MSIKLIKTRTAQIFIRGIIASTWFLIVVLFIFGCIAPNGKIRNESTSMEIDEIVTQLMSFEEYEQVIASHARPYIYQLNAVGRSLLYFGSEHSANPSDAMFKHLRNCFLTFRPDIILVEGLMPLRRDASKFKRLLILRKMRKMTDEEAIKKGGESLFSLMLAAESKIEVLCPEPSLTEEIESCLSKGFRQDHIFVYYVCRPLSHYHRASRDVSAEEYLKPYIRRFKAATRWKGFDYSVKHLVAVAKDICGEQFDVEHRLPREFVSPVTGTKSTVINEISRQSAIFRDAHIIREIVSLTDTGTYKRVMVVYGSGHAVMQEKALRMIFKKYG